MVAFLNLTGRRFTKLLVIRCISKGPTRWLCQCDCGDQTTVATGNLTSQAVRSCGCLSREITGALRRTHGCSTANEGHNTPEYSIWKGMWSRCRDTDCATHGGRGITVCEKWKSFEAFFEDMGEKPTPRSTIERKDNNGNYEPSNCVWASYAEQNRNKRNNRNIEYQGVTRCLTDWARILGMSHTMLLKRLNRGLSIEEAFNAPPRR